MEAQAGRAYVYALMDADTGAVLYVGVTMDPKKREHQHLHGWDELTADWIRSLPSVPVFKVLEETSLRRAAIKENKWIRHYAKFGSLKNARRTRGGFSMGYPDTRLFRSVIKSVGHGTITSFAASIGRSPQWVSMAVRGMRHVSEKMKETIRSRTASRKWPTGFIWWRS